MEDRGEKIVTLARELLRSEEPVYLPEPASHPISIKVLCFATLLTALGSSAITQWVDDGARPLTHYEKVELKALVFYAARQNSVAEEVFRREIANRTGLRCFDDFTRYDYTIARDYLQSEIR